MKFLHAADIHLDSPMRGVSRRLEGISPDLLRQATRRALTQLVDLALAEEVAFLLLAGDLFDGEWPDFRSGLFFVREMQRLREAGIPVLVVRGNHDAERSITRHLTWPDNVHLFPSDGASTRLLEEEGVAVHGISYAQAAESRNLAAALPPPLSGLFNIGLVHTSLDGRPGHAPYAPCSLATLREKGYDYWALGHVHQREVIGTSPWIVFPGNLQGRHVRETGAKGATLVEVRAGQVASARHVALDVVRWHRLEVEIQGEENATRVLDRLEEAMRALAREERPLLVRAVAKGATPAHPALALDPKYWREELAARIADLPETHLAGVRFDTDLPGTAALAFQDGEALADWVAALADAGREDGALLAEALAPVLARLPQELKAEMGLDETFDPNAWFPRARDLLLSRLLAEGDGT